MSSSEEDELCLLLLLRKRKRRRNNRSCSVHPLHIQRPSKGVYHTLFNDLIEDDKIFFNYFRMSKTSFDVLLTKIEESITPASTHFKNAISPRERLALTLR